MRERESSKERMRERRGEREREREHGNKHKRRLWTMTTNVAAESDIVLIWRKNNQEMT